MMVNEYLTCHSRRVQHVILSERSVPMLRDVSLGERSEESVPLRTIAPNARGIRILRSPAVGGLPQNDMIMSLYLLDDHDRDDRRIYSLQGHTKILPPSPRKGFE